MTKEYKIALNEYDLKNYEKAYTLFEKLAKSGEVDAQVTLASMLYEGNKIRQDISKAYFTLVPTLHVGTHTRTQTTKNAQPPKVQLFLHRLFLVTTLYVVMHTLIKFSKKTIEKK